MQACPLTQHTPKSQAAACPPVPPPLSRRPARPPSRLSPFPPDRPPSHQPARLPTFIPTRALGGHESMARSLMSRLRCCPASVSRVQRISALRYTQAVVRYTQAVYVIGTQAVHTGGKISRASGEQSRAMGHRGHSVLAGGGIGGQAPPRGGGVHEGGAAAAQGWYVCMGAARGATALSGAAGRAGGSADPLQWRGWGGVLMSMREEVGWWGGGGGGGEVPVAQVVTPSGQSATPCPSRWLACCAEQPGCCAVPCCAAPCAARRTLPSPDTPLPPLCKSL